MPENPARRPKAVVIRIRRKPKGQKKLFAAVALVAYLVQPGDTLSGIGASHSASLSAVEAANPQFSDPNLIYVGQTVHIPEGSSAWQQSSGSSAWQQSSAPRSYAATGSGSQSAPVQQSTPSSQPTSGAAGTVTQSSSGGSSGTASAVTPSSSGGSSGSSSSSLSDVPGVPASFAACVAFRESTNLQNPAANGNAYGIIPASGYNVAGTSLAYQKQVFAELYAQYGAKPWASDGC
jgi:LysM repeat protein